MWILHQFSCFWASIYIWINPLWKVKIYGRENIKKNQVYVLVANHYSSEDIIILYMLFKHFKWVSKKENFRIPFFGWNMYFNQYIIIDRSSKSSIKKMFKDSIKKIKEGNSIMIFPEGTRSKDGILRKFKEGAFKIALETKVSIIPILIRGTENQLLQKKGLIRGRQEIQVEVQNEIKYEDFKDLDSRQLADKVKSTLKIQNNSDINYE